MRREKGKESLREAVKRLDRRLWHQLEDVWRLAEEGIHDMQRSKDGHQQGTPHCLAVEEHLAGLIPDEWKGTQFTATDIFVLSVAAALHDMGKAGDVPGDHGHISMWELRDRAMVFGLDEGQAEVVGWVVRAHNDGDLEALPAEPIPLGSTEVNLRLLAALFKLADVLHLDYRRVSRQVVEFGGKQAEDNPKTRFRMRVRGWRFNDRGQIEIYAVPKDWDDVAIIHTGFEMTRCELEPCLPTLQDAGLPWNLVLRLDETELEHQARVEVEAERRVEHAFVGMDYFTEMDAYLFKGRGEDAQALWHRVMVENVTLLVGDSGVGKTSLVRAGLFPRLHQARWCTAYTRPFDDPDHFIIRDLWRELLDGEPPVDVTIVDTLARVCSSVGDRKVLVVIDQFEDIARLLLFEMLHGVRRALVAVKAGRFHNLRLLISYRADAEGTLGPLFQEVAGSDRGLHRVYLQPLSSAGARAALEAGFAQAQVGMDNALLLCTIADDLEVQTLTAGVYPPYVQMVGEMLCRAAREENESILTEALYRARGGSEGIIGYYLLQRLAEFGEREEEVRRILVALVRSGGIRSQRSLDDLQTETQLDTDSLVSLLDDLVGKRMVRHLGSESFEVIHDHLALLVSQEIVDERERQLKELRELLNLKARMYVASHTLLQTPDMARLYTARERVAPDEGELRLLLHSHLLEHGPAWFWLQDLRRDRVMMLLRDAVVSPIPLLRQNAIPILAQVAGLEVVPELREMLRDGDEEVRRMAIWALAHVEGQEAIPDLRRVLKDANSAVRWMAEETMIQLDNSEVVSDLRQMLDDEDRYVQERTMRALVQLAGGEALPDVLGILADEKRDEGVRRVAGELLIEIASPGALPISVLQGLLKAQDWIANRSARQALVRIVTREDIPVLKEMLNSEVEYLQWAASEALVEVVEREDIPALREMVRSEDERVQWVAAESLGQVVEREDVPDLREMLEDDDEYVHWAAAKALARLAEQEDIPDLEIMLKDKDPDARRAAIQALGRVAGQDAIPHILEMLPDKDRKVWHTAVTVLLQISKQMGREALPILRTLVRALSVFEEFDSEHRDKLWAAAELLAQIEGREALPYVQEIVGRMESLDARIDLRRIAQVLRQMGQEATPDLLLLLREAGGPMQEAAAWALAQVAETESAVDWRDFLKVRYLPWLGESQVLEALEKFVAEDDLTELAEWVACHAAAGGGGVACSLLIHLDRRLYCPFDLEWVELPLFPPSHVLAPVSDV